jgi:hypothetical protein
MFGLQGISATESILTVKIIVFNPKRAHAKAASHPA